MSSVSPFRRSFMDLDAELHPENYDLEPLDSLDFVLPSISPPLPKPVPAPVRRGEIAGFLRVTRRMTDPKYGTDSDLWYCDCYCGNQVSEIFGHWIQDERDRDPADENEWWICNCGQELDEPPLACQKEYEYRLADPDWRKYRLPPIYKPELLQPPKINKFRHFRLAFIAATFPPHWEENGRVLISKALREQVLKQGGYRCKRCKSTEDLTIDHIVPVVQGGPTIIWNLQVLCRRCNSRKGAR